MKIAIDLGHGVGPDRGAVGVVTEESIINSVGELVVAKLRILGHEVLTVRPSSASSVTDSLEQRCNAANNFGAERYISIHANAGGGHGTEVYTYQGKEVEFARNILNNLVSLGFTDRGIKGEGLYVTHYTNMPACLVEVCFCDTQSDIDLYNGIGSDKISDAIVKGIVGQTVVVNINQQPTPAVKTPMFNLDDWVARLQAECNRQGFSNQNVDGVPGPNTLAGCPLIKAGAMGNITKLVQIKLGITADSIFGDQTKQAVISFQRAHGLTPDSVVGQNTWRALLGI